ncbi:MAG: hypothetical protein AVDCRST_MAG11-1065, partial [uncultured Gemmatimonadaceae bacterium]
APCTGGPCARRTATRSRPATWRWTATTSAPPGSRPARCWVRFSSACWTACWTTRASTRASGSSRSSRPVAPPRPAPPPPIIV